MPYVQCDSSNQFPSKDQCQHFVHFIPARCPIYNSDKFRITTFPSSPENDLTTNISLLTKNAIPEFPMASSITKRGSAPAHSIGLQYQCATQHHLSRFCQNNNSIPSVNLGSPFSSQTKQLLLHATLNILEEENKVFAQCPSPFVLDSLNQTYLDTRDL